ISSSTGAISGMGTWRLRLRSGRRRYIIWPPFALRHCPVFMLIEFFYELRDGGLQPSVTEFLTLLEAMQAHVSGMSVDDFYYLARASLVKDERQFDRFDQLFGHYFQGIESLGEDPQTD